jgi:hypothetical protein
VLGPNLVTLVLAFAALACRQSPKPPAIDPTSSLPQVLAPLADAREIQQKVVPGHGAGVSYTIQAEYPALNVVNEIVTRAAVSGWEPLSEDFFNKGIPTSHVRGWTSYLDLSRSPQAAMHQWQSGWRNADGDLLEYSLWYRSENVRGARPPDKPENRTLFVTGQIILKKDAEVLRTSTVEEAKRLQESTSAMNPTARADAARQVQLIEIGNPGHMHHVYSISEFTLVRLPEWQPEKDPPPLAMAEAISRAREWARKRHPKFDDLRLRNIQLQEIQCDTPVRNRWFYMLSFDPVVEGRESWGGDVTVIVLMDGSIVTPIEKRGD